MNNIIIFQTRPGIGDIVLFLSGIHQIAKKTRNLIFILSQKKERELRIC